MIKNYSYILRLPYLVVLLLRLSLVRLSAVNDVAYELRKQVVHWTSVMTLLWSDEIYLHRVVIVYAGIANINTCQAQEFLNLICFQSVVPQHLPTHPPESPVRVRHQPPPEFLPSWLDRPRITCKH